MHGPNGQGTKSNILKGINWLTKGTKSGDVLYVHYSGHGGTIRATADRGESDGIDSTWIPVDYLRAGVILDNDLRKLLAESIPPGVTIWVTSDSCHSGTVLDLRYGFSDTSFRSVTKEYSDIDDEIWGVRMRDGKEVEISTKGIFTASSVKEDRYYALTRGIAYLLSGCKDTQTSADTFEDNLSQGALTWALFSVLSRNKATPLKYLLRDVSGKPRQPPPSTGCVCNLDDAFNATLKL